MAHDLLPVDSDRIAPPHVLKYEFSPLLDDHRMTARDEGVIKNDVHGRIAPEEERSVGAFEG